MRTYKELLQYQTFEERLAYLSIKGRVGEDTFGWDRHLNQKFYRSREWRNLRNEIIARDNGCDMALPGYDIGFGFYIHHIEPITVDDLYHSTDRLWDKNNLVLVSRSTHDAIHYGYDNKIPRMAERVAGDTCPWRR